MSSTTTLATVDFHGQPLTVITDGDQHLVAMKPICENIGLSWSGQFERLRRDEVLQSTVRVIRMVAEDSKDRELICLPLDMLNGWLFGIDVSRCRKEIQPALIQYKRECYGVLAAYWQKGEAVNPRKATTKALPNGLSLEQQDAVKALVKARVEAVPKNKQAKAAITCWSALKSKFGCAYKQIDPAQFGEAVSLLARVDLEGEWIEADKPDLVRPLSIHWPLECLAERREGMLSPYNERHNALDVSLHDLRECFESPVEMILSELARNGYVVDAAWWEIRTYHNKMQAISSALGALNYCVESPQRYIVNK